MSTHIMIRTVTADEAEQVCRSITADLPEYFGLPECNEQYAQGVRARTNMCIEVNGTMAGLLSMEFPYPNNANIYWMGIIRSFHRQGLGKSLLKSSVELAKRMGAETMTVETLAPSESDESYMKTYRFYESNGFKPMFHLKPEGYKWDMVYMVKYL
ncbi:MAG: GNAT family N-acetyltransferase [Pseudomonadota bacterium]